VVFTNKNAKQLIQDVLDSLYRAGLIKQELIAKEDEILLGVNSPLDSLAFVTFISDLEDRLSRDCGREITLLLDEIYEIISDGPCLSVEAMMKYLVKLIEGLPE
jgi:hypothetical protein